MSAREEILRRIRDAIGGDAVAPAVPRDYRTHTGDGLETFTARLDHYQAKWRRVPASDLGGAVRSALAERGAKRIVAAVGVPTDWLRGVEAVQDDPPLEPHALDALDGVVSTCAVAVAETGTIVLDGSDGMGRRALSLVPDYHLCVVRADQIVSSVPEAIARLDPTRPLTFVSGPSATVDIELVRIGGVHGPRTLEVVIAE